MVGMRSRSGIWLAAIALCLCACLSVVHYSYLAGEPAPVPPSGPTQPPPDESRPNLTLEEDQRQYLWEIEHHGNVLGRHGFQRFAEALRQADEQSLQELLAPGFSGQVLKKPREVRLDTDFAQVVRQEEAGHPSESLDRHGFLARLLEYRQPFTQPPKVKFSLMALRPTVPEDLNSVWQGSCMLRMWGEMGPGQPGEVVLHLKYFVSRPAQDSSYRGGWMQSCDITQSQVAHSPGFLLREATAERGIDPGLFHDNWKVSDPEPATGGVYLCDYDRDGILDLLITDFKRYAMYKGMPGGKFRDVTREVGLPDVPQDRSALSITAAFVDIDGDGWEDLILGDHLYRNLSGKQFVDITFRSNLRLPRDLSGLAVADFDGDGRVDLYVTRPGIPKTGSWLDGKSGDPKGNLLLRNKGNWQFEDVTARAGAAGGQRSTFSAVWLDANNDGWPDLYVINEFGNGVLLLNNGDGTFREQQLTEGPSDFGSMGVTCGDIDNDGNIDLYVANMYSKAGNRVIGNLRPGTYSEAIMAKMRRFVTGSQLYRNQGCDGVGRIGNPSYDKPGFLPQFEPLGQRFQVADVGWAYGAALVDLDNDGWLDLYATCGFNSRSRTEPDG